MKKFTLTAALILLFSFAHSTSAQNTGIGAYIGGGYIGGESPDIGSANFSIFVDVDPGISSLFYPRLTFFYAGDFDHILPGTRYRYFPFMKGFSLKGILTQQYEDNYFIEGGLGAIYLNDRTFSFTNNWEIGAVFSVTAGIDLTQNLEGFKLGLGTEYAFTFSGTFPKYFSLHLQTKYVF